MADYVAFLMVLLAAFVYAFLGYLKNYGQAFKPEKLILTAILALVFAIQAFLSGAPVSEETWVMFITMYAGLIVILESFIKALLKRLWPSMAKSLGYT